MLSRRLPSLWMTVPVVVGLLLGALPGAPAPAGAPAWAAELPVSTATTTGTLILTPPLASKAPAAIVASPSLVRDGKQLHGLGLTPPGTGQAAPSVGAPPASLASPAPSVDLSQYDMPVGNQGQVNSCASWATGYNLMGWYATRQADGGAPYAPMFVYSQVTGGQDVGTSFEGNFGIEQQQGIDTQADYYQGNYDYWDQPTAAERANAANYKIKGYTTIYTQGAGNAQQAIENAMTNGQPVVVGIPVYSNFMYASASTPYVDVPPPGSTYYGGHAIMGVKYDANGLWIENQWGTGWGLNGYVELSWAFVDGYAISAYTLTGFTGPAAGPTPTARPATATATPSTATSVPPATATPVTSAQLTVSPSSGLPGTNLTISGAGFGAGIVEVYWGGVLTWVVTTSNGSFSVPATIALSAAPGPRSVTASNLTTGKSAGTTFTVLGAAATATAVPATATATPLAPTATATRPAATNTAVPPARTATSTATATPSHTLTLTPSSGHTGILVSVTGSGFPPYQTINLLWAGRVVGSTISSGTGQINGLLTVPSTAPGPYTVGAQPASGSGLWQATFTVN